MARTVTTLWSWVRYGLFAISLIFAPMVAKAAPYAALVMDMRSGEVLYSRNADTRLHPASLTKMMTLYITFQAVERGELSLDQMVTVSKNAAGQPPSRLGLRPGQKIAVRYLIRAAAIKSANDAAAALGDAISGNEAAFAARMNRTAKALGMQNTTFRNANGLTRTGHLSTARDMTLLGRHLFYDFPQYYNIFSRKTADAGMKKVYNTNRRFLGAYEGADGIKTGYTNAAGFNLTASAKRGDKRIIATVFGGTSTAQRNAKMAELMNMGFSRAPRKAPISRPKPAPSMLVANAGQTMQVSGLVKTSPFPRPRPARTSHDADAIALALAAAQVAVEAPSEAQEDAIVLASAGGLTQSPFPMARPGSIQTASPKTIDEPAKIVIAEAEAPANGFVQTTPPQPETLTLASAVVTDEQMAEGDTDEETGFDQQTEPQPETLALTTHATQRNDKVILASLSPSPVPLRKGTVVARASSSGGRGFGVSLGLYNSNFTAERALLTTALMETDSLGEALRKVAKRKAGFEATFVGMSRDMADLACARLSARAKKCNVIGP